MRSAILEVYVSTDVEADGPIPGPHSMLSFGSAAYTADKRLLQTFSANLETLPGAQGVLRHGVARQGVSGIRQEEHAQGMVRSNSPHTRCIG